VPTVVPEPTQIVGAAPARFCNRKFILRLTLRRNVYSVKRSLIGLAAALALAAGLAGIAPIAASAAPGCNIEPYGLIGERWAQLGGAAVLGCPTTEELDVYRGNIWAGRLQRFTLGEIAWTPGQSSGKIVAAWQRGGYAYFDWRGTIRPYDVFLVRWDSPAGGGQQEVAGGTGQRFRIRQRTNGSYSFIAEGCLRRTFGGLGCAGWTMRVRTQPE
jgi:hypothetical protein